ncbi:MAG: hypothetical protein LBF90_01955 [Prevotellaceae bacterium]|jgi:hypothetical protein|nr:hypothetical protein [Prevotellaceae bacterium]
MKKIVFLIYLFSATTILAQEKTIKEQALEEFKKEHHSEAIVLMEQALEKEPNDAEIYYYLGVFNHYRAYDSHPLQGYDFAYSEKIFKYLNKAIELNPDFGNAKYFYGAECSANAFVAMQHYDAEKLRFFYQKAYDKGAYPPWLVEFGKNIMNTCPVDAILFTAGNADFDICMYLQQCQEFRKDITVIPLGNIDRIWYVQFLKNGLKDAVTKINIHLTDNQIVDIHPFKWRTTTISMPVSKKMKEEYALVSDFRMNWNIEPDLFSNRKHAKLEGEEAIARTYLSPQRAVLLQIVKDNLAERDICFTNFASPTFYGGLDNYFQDCGLVSKLLPFKTGKTDYQVDINSYIALLQPKNVADFSTVKTADIQRVGGKYIYYSIFSRLATYYKSIENNKQLQTLIDFYKKYLSIGYDEQYEKEVLEEAMNTN